MTEVAANVPELAGEAARRADAALALRTAAEPFDVVEARRVFDAMVGSGSAGGVS
jgi:hypothetical protein